MTTRRLFVGLLAVLVMAVVSCGRTLVFPRVQKCVFDSDCSDGLHCIDQECRPLADVDGGLRKRFGEPCDAGAQCDSDYCVGGPTGAFCSRQCDSGDAGCPTSYACKSIRPTVVGPDGGVLDAGPRVNLCTVPQPMLCQSCRRDLDCGASGADLCLSLDGGQFCGRDCTVDGCPQFYACRAGADGAKQCVPEGRTCDCVADTIGLQKACRGQPNGFGTCAGTQRCQADGGFTACDAPPALEETCNGVDDDCNGRIDDFTPPTCTKTVGNVTCTGPQICMASAGLVCGARPPEAEVCNGQDDDCNGKVDEPFVDAAGRYVTAAHCGMCGNDCSKAIAHATSATCDTTPMTPRCRVTQCAPGYFPFDDGRLCLELPDTLCHPCLADSDCVGPGARCLTVDGQKVCGRDCGPSSAYPPGCPAGYTCTASGGSSQCTPVTGTCSCRVSTLNSTRSCMVSTCRGFERCTLGPNGAEWATCDVATFNPEICDGKDNNCNGQVDEGFRNPGTGRYDTASHCGFCNNDCTKYFSPTLQHTTGVCDTTPAMPACTMGACLTETSGGTTFEWVNVNGLTNDGCECRRVQGNTTDDLPDRQPSTTSADSWVDQNCDGIDGVLTDALFVSAEAPAGGNGSRTAPYQTITQGLTALQGSAKKYVLVAQGLYRENVRLFDGAQLFGGYSSDFLKRDPKVHVTQWVGVQPGPTAGAALHAEGLGTGAAETVVAGFTIIGWDVPTGAAEGTAGQASIAVFLHDVGSKFVLASNDVIAGRGGTGGRGTTGTQGFGRQASPTLSGGKGANSTFFPSGGCTAGNHRTGPAGGVNAQCATGNASAGGSVICPVYSFAGHQGQQQQYVSTTGTRNGRGGFDWSFDSQSGGGCSHVTESGWPSNIQQHDGEDGKQGVDGSGGLGGGGAGTSARFGSVSGGRWVPVALASGGVAGLVGEGGGGGGAGGGVARFAGACVAWEIGATGGGGGAGGCGGSGGLAGGAGGASIAILITFSAPGVLPVILNNRIQRGRGGNGGDGGFGGAGGLGGAGGFGGLADRWSSSVGGKGGEGGNGGPGGGGGGGAGGPAFAVLGFNVDVSGLSMGNTLLTPDSVVTGGVGGAGGSSPGANASSGTPGTNGASVNLLSLQSCATPCAMGTTCDGNGVCLPN